MLEEYDKIDTITKSDDGKIQLVIMDAGLTEDPDERYGHLINKLRTYVAYATSSTFQEKHPDVPPIGLAFWLCVASLPTRKMESTTTIARADNQDRMFPISYRHFPGTDDDTEEAPTPLDRKAVNRAEIPSNVPVHNYIWIPISVYCGLALFDLFRACTGSPFL